jgi:uncharacterized RDD family membrane protein YckC
VSAVPPRAAPSSGVPAGELEYVGFWLRVLAALVDTLWVTPIVVLLGFMYENASSTLADALVLDPAGVSVAALTKALAPTPADFVVQYLLPAVLVVLFWRRRSATPGKMLIHARIVDANTGAAPTLRQLVIRYLGYYVSIVPLLLGLLWVGWDRRKQGWHDKLAGTVVVRPTIRPAASVTFPRQDAR